MSMTGQEYLARFLHAYGVTHAFMVPTSFVASSVEMDRLGITVVSTHGEKAAAYMADGYARVRGTPGVCHAQTIGAANLAAGLRDAYMGGSPVIALTGGRDPMTTYRHVYQEIVDFPLFEQVTKANFQLQDVRRAPDLLRQAFREATTGAPGPVHLEVDGLSGNCLDGVLDVSAVIHEPRFAAAPAFRPGCSDAEILAFLEVLASAQRPVLVAGGGVTRSGAAAALLAVAEALAIPVATSMNAKGTIDECSPLALGVVGSYSRASANRAVSEADLVCFVGSHAGSQVTDRWRLPEGQATRVVQIDLDPRELGRNYVGEAYLQGDARTILDAMHRLVATGTYPDRDGWISTVQAYVADWRRQAAPNLTSEAVPMRPERVCGEIQRILPDDGVVVSDTGHAGIWTASMLDLRPGQTYLRCAGSLGWAFPAALGAQCGAPDRRVIAFTGDGGFYYHLAEVETAVRYNIPAIIVVNDNRALSQDLKPYRSAYGWEPTAAGDRMWMFEDLDLAAVAASLGCRSVRAETPRQLRDALEAAMRVDGPVVIDAVTDVEALPDPPYGGRDFYATPAAEAGTR